MTERDFEIQIEEAIHEYGRQVKEARQAGRELPTEPTLKATECFECGSPGQIIIAEPPRLQMSCPHEPRLMAKVHKVYGSPFEDGKR